MPLTDPPHHPLFGLRRMLPSARGRSHRALCLLLGLGSWLWAGPARAQLSFAPPTTYATGGSPISVALGDLDLDGRLDLVVANSGSATITVRLGQPNGTLGSRADYATGTSPYSVALADLNGDGKLDAVTANRDAATVSVLLGTGTGSFSPRTDYSTGTGSAPVAVVALKIDGDQRPDLVVANNATNGVRILINNGAGAFPSSSFQGVSAIPTSLAVGRLDGDGYDDVAVGNNSFYVSLLMGAGGAFISSSANAGLRQTAVAIADVDRNGGQDLAISGFNSGSFAILDGMAGGGFGDPELYAVGGSPAGIVAQDLSGDGWPDVAVTSYAGSALAVFYGDGAGRLTRTTDVPAGSLPYAVAAGDLDGDGLPDLVATNLGAATVSVLRQTPSPPLIRVVPAALAFGPGFQGTSQVLSMRVQNVGTLPLEITAMTLEGSTEFSLLDPTSFVLGRGEYRDVRVQFARSQAGSFEGTLTISSNDAGQPSVTVTCSGSAIVPPVAELSPGSLALAAYTRDSDSGALSLSNSGGSPLTWTLAVVGGPQAWLTFDPFAGAVQPGAKTSVTVNASAGRLEGGTYTVTLRLTTNDPVRPQIDVPLSFTVTSVPRISIDPPALDFSAGYLGVPEVLSARVQNVGTETLEITGMTLEGSAEFSLLDPASFVLAVSEARDVRVRYARSQLGSFAGTLTIPNNDPRQPSVTVPLSGSAALQPAADLSPPSLELTANSGDAAAGTLSLSNPGGVALTWTLAAIGGPPPWLTFSPSAGTLQPGIKIYITVNASAAALVAGTYTTTLRLTSNDPVRPQIDVPVTFTVTGVARISVTPAALDFGSDFVGAVESLSVLVRSTGTDSLHVASMTTDSPEFAVSGATAFAIAAGGTRTSWVRYLRLSVATVSGTLTIESDATTPSVTVALSGAATPAPEIAVTPAAVDVTLFMGESTVVPISIANPGKVTLEFTVDVGRPGGVPLARAAPLAPSAPPEALSGRADEVFSIGDPQPSAALPGAVDVRPLGAVDARPVPLSGAVPGVLSTTSVLVIADGGTETDVAPILSSAGYPVTLVADDSAWDGLHPSPAAFGAVVLLDGVDFGDDMPAAAQQALVEYVQNGGGLIVTEWASYEITQGRYAGLGSVLPITRTTGVTGLLNYHVVGSHPVTEGVSANFAVTAAVTVGAVNSGTAVVALSSGAPAVVVKEEGQGRVVAFAIAGNYNGRRPFLSADVRRLLLNATSWAIGFRWLSLGAQGGTVPPGGKQSFDLMLSAARLTPGVEQAELVIDSNDPVSPRVIVPIRLTVEERPTPVLVSLVSQEVEADRVRLVWHTSGADLPLAMLYRSRSGEEWRALRELAADGVGRIVWEDRDVAAGTRYGYRLGMREGGAETIAGEVWVETPAAVLALHGVWPNPTDRELVASFSLPDRAHARLELFDLHGRRWAEVSLERLGPGRHDVTLAPRGRVPPGLYWVRLTHGDRTFAARALVLR